MPAGHASMQIGAGAGAVPALLTRLMGVRQAVEVGTFTGLSSLAIARGLADGGRLICFDISEEFTADRRAATGSGPASTTGSSCGSARPPSSCASCPTSRTSIWLHRRRQGRLPDLLGRSGAADAPGRRDRWSTTCSGPAGWSIRRRPADRAMAEFNDMALADGRVELVILPLLDGLTMARKR